MNLKTISIDDLEAATGGRQDQENKYHSSRLPTHHIGYDGDLFQTIGRIAGSAVGSLGSSAARAAGAGEGKLGRAVGDAIYGAPGGTKPR